MITITSVEFQRNFGRYQDEALKEPVSITTNGRERIVVLSADEYHRLKRRDRKVMSLDEFSDEDIRAIESAQAPREASALDHEVLG
jgi:prevent-host-death family protein